MSDIHFKGRSVRTPGSYVRDLMETSKDRLTKLIDADHFHVVQQWMITNSPKEHTCCCCPAKLGKRKVKILMCRGEKGLKQFFFCKVYWTAVRDWVSWSGWDDDGKTACGCTTKTKPVPELESITIPILFDEAMVTSLMSGGQVTITRGEFRIPITIAGVKQDRLLVAFNAGIASPTVINCECE